MRSFRQSSVLVVLLLLGARSLMAQQADTPLPDAPSSSSRAPGLDIQKLHFDPAGENSTDNTLQPGEDPQNRLFKPFLKHMVQDQKTFWMSATDITHGGAKAFFPFAAFT